MKSLNLYRIADMIQVNLHCESSSRVHGASMFTVPSTGQSFTLEAIESKVSQDDGQGIVLFRMGTNAMLAIHTVIGGKATATLLAADLRLEGDWHHLLRKDWLTLTEYLNLNATSQWEW